MAREVGEGLAQDWRRVGRGSAGFLAPSNFRPKYPPYRETGVAIPCRTVFPVALQTIAATPPLLSVKMAYRGLKSQKTDLTRGASQQRLASEAYRAIGGVARNSIANRAVVGY